MLKRRVVESGLILSLILALGAVAFGQSSTTQTETAPQTKTERKARKSGRTGKEGKRARHDKFGKRAFGNLNLTDEQKNQMNALREQNKGKFSSQHQELRTLAQKKRQGTLTTDDQARFDSLRNELIVARQQMREQISSILTAGQKQQIGQRKQEMKLRREEMKQRRDEMRKRKQETKPFDGAVIK